MIDTEQQALEKESIAIFQAMTRKFMDSVEKTLRAYEASKRQEKDCNLAIIKLEVIDEMSIGVVSTDNSRILADAIQEIKARKHYLSADTW